MGLWDGCIPQIPTSFVVYNTSSNTDEFIKIIVASNLHHQDSSEASCSHVLTVMTMIIFCTCRYNCSQCTNHGCKLLRTTFQMCLIHWTHRHSIAVVVFDSNGLSWLPLGILLWFGKVNYNIRQSSYVIYLLSVKQIYGIIYKG